MTREDKKTFKLVCSEFVVLTHQYEKKYLVDGHKTREQSELKTSDDLLREATDTTKKTTQMLKSSMQDLHNSVEIGQDALITISIDNDKLANINTKLDTIDSDAKIAGRLITRFSKRLYTDKLIISFVIIIVCLIIIMILFKYDIL